MSSQIMSNPDNKSQEERGSESKDRATDSPNWGVRATTHKQNSPGDR